MRLDEISSENRSSLLLRDIDADIQEDRYRANRIISCYEEYNLPFDINIKQHVVAIYKKLTNILKLLEQDVLDDEDPELPEFEQFVKNLLKHISVLRTKYKF